MKEGFTQGTKPLFQQTLFSQPVEGGSVLATTFKEGKTLCTKPLIQQTFFETKFFFYSLFNFSQPHARLLANKLFRGR